MTMMIAFKTVDGTSGYMGKDQFLQVKDTLKLSKTAYFQSGSDAASNQKRADSALAYDPWPDLDVNSLNLDDYLEV